MINKMENHAIYTINKNKLNIIFNRNINSNNYKEKDKDIIIIRMRVSMNNNLCHKINQTVK